MPPSRCRILCRAGLTVVLAGAVALAGTGLAAAAPSKVPPVAHAEVLAPAWAPVGGDLSAGVRVRLARDVSRLEVRLRVYAADDTLVWQRTQTRHSLSDQTYLFSFARPVRELGLGPGVYTARAQLRADSASPVEATATLLVADPAGTAVPVSVIVRVAGAPARDPSGRFVVDPMQDGGARSEAAALAQLALLRPDLRLSAAVAPVLLEDWRDAADGYALASADGTENVSSEGTGAVACRGTLDALGRATTSGLALLRGMYAEPDAEGLVRSGADAAMDVADQLALGSTVTSDALASANATGSVISTGLAVLGGALPSSVATSIVRSGIGFVVLDASALSLGAEKKPVPGIYTLATPSGSTAPALRALAIDGPLSRALLAKTGAAELREQLLRRALARGGTDSPVVLELVVGDGGASVSDAQPALAALAGLPWVRLVDAAGAGSLAGEPASLLSEAPASIAPAGYWDAVASARTRAKALASAAPKGDADAQRCLRDLMLAGSRCWAGADGAWQLKARGLEYARDAEAVASETLSAVHLTIPAVTLSGSAGRVPVSIENDSDKVLSVVVTGRSPRIRVSKPLNAQLHPGENILSLPVDLGQSLTSPLSVTVTAGGVRIVESTATIRASYLDRIVLLGGVVLVLLLLLWYIHGKARPALARRRQRADDIQREAADTPERPEE